MCFLAPPYVHQFHSYIHRRDDTITHGLHTLEQECLDKTARGKNKRKEGKMRTRKARLGTTQRRAHAPQNISVSSTSSLFTTSRYARMLTHLHSHEHVVQVIYTIRQFTGDRNATACTLICPTDATPHQYNTATTPLHYKGHTKALPHMRSRVIHFIAFTHTEPPRCTHAH